MNASCPDLIPLLCDSSDVCNIFIRTSAVTPSTTCQLHIIFKSQWTGKIKSVQEMLKTDLCFPPLYPQDSRKDPHFPKHPDLPCNLDPFVDSAALPDDFSLVEDGSEPYGMWFSDIHANERSIKLCHSPGNMLPHRLIHRVGSRTVGAWSSSAFQHALRLPVSSVWLKRNERAANTAQRSLVQVPHASFMQMLFSWVKPHLKLKWNHWTSLKIWVRLVLSAGWPLFYILFLWITESARVNCSTLLFTGSSQISSTSLQALISQPLQWGARLRSWK